MQPLLQLADDIGEVRDCALLRFQYVHPLDSIPELSLFLEVQPVTLVVTFDQRAEERKQELQVLFCPRKRERIDGEVARLATDIQIAAAEYRRQRLEAAADIENESERLILLRILEQKATEVRFAAARHAKNQCVGDLSVMEIEKVGCGIVRFKNGQILGAQVLVPPVSLKDREQE